MSNLMHILSFCNFQSVLLLVILIDVFVERPLKTAYAERQHSLKELDMKWQMWHMSFVITLYVCTMCKYDMAAEKSRMINCC